MTIGSLVAMNKEIFQTSIEFDGRLALIVDPDPPLDIGPVTVHIEPRVSSVPASIFIGEAFAIEVEFIISDTELSYYPGERGGYSNQFFPLAEQMLALKISKP